MRSLITALVVATLSFGTLHAPAQAADYEPWGTFCGLAAHADPTIPTERSYEAGVGVLFAGPVFVRSGTPLVVTCSIWTSIGTAAEVTASGTGGVSVAELVSWFPAPALDVCTRVEYADGREWARCDPVSYSTYDDTFVQFVDPTLCPQLSIQASPATGIESDGDIEGVWDCPPYDRATSYWRDYRVIWAVPYVGFPSMDALDPGPPPATSPPACGDGIDNDNDGRTDYPYDPDCTDRNDPSEHSAQPQCTNTGGVTYCTALTATTLYEEYAVAPPLATTHVSGYVDAYDFILPNEGVVTLPCVVLLAASTSGNPCELAGGRFVSRSQTLVDNQPVPDPSSPPGSPVAWVRVCNANLVATVNGFGVSAFPIYTVC